MRTSMGKDRPTAARTFSTTSRGKRIRFSKLPPQRSVRWLVSSEMNWWSSQPWPMWIITMSKPQALAFTAPSAKASAIRSMSASVISSTVSPHSST